MNIETAASPGNANQCKKIACYSFILLSATILTLGSDRSDAREPEPIESPSSHSGRTDVYGDLLPPRALARLGTIRLRHDSGVNAVAFSPNRRWLASAASPFAARGHVALAARPAAGRAGCR